MSFLILFIKVTYTFDIGRARLISIWHKTEAIWEIGNPYTYFFLGHLSFIIMAKFLSFYSYLLILILIFIGQAIFLTSDNFALNTITLLRLGKIKQNDVPIYKCNTYALPNSLLTKHFHYFCVLANILLVIFLSHD